MKLISSSFTDSSELPEKYTCLGENFNPPLEIQEAPEGTESFILIIEDISSEGSPWVHWILFNIPPDEFQIKEKSIPYKAVEILNSNKNFEYEGPCPKTFKSPHEISFKVYALDEMFELPKEFDKEMLLNAAQGHILEEANLSAICSPAA